MVNSGASPVHSFASAVDNAMGSIGGDLGAFHVHGFASAVNNAMISTSGSLGALSVYDFASAVNNAMSSTSGSLGALPVYGFASAVNNAMISTSGSLGALPEHGFASAVNNAMSSTSGSLGALPVHSFASAVDNAIRSRSRADLGRSSSPVHGFAMEDVCGSFRLAELVAATNNFSRDNTISHGRIGFVYKGKLFDGREVAIKRAGTSTSNIKEFQSITLGPLFLTNCLHHKHLVRLLGLCEEKSERLLVYQHMKNRALYDHLHDKNNVEKGSTMLNSLKMRIKIYLDASRGIEYIHNHLYSIHGNIKSSNILLDATWTAKVSDFGKVSAGTPHVWTEESDVYGFGVVLLELLTGKKPILKNEEDGSTRLHVIDFAEPAILAGELVIF